MRLELFDLLDDASDTLISQQDDFIEAEVRIIQCLKSVMTSHADSIMELSSRIKTPLSLREKIIRNKLYHDFENGQQVINFLHDLVGVTIKCQFIKEEKMLYARICEVFNLQSYDGYYYTEKFPTIFMDLEMSQPQIQKNGCSIYRIDGFCRIGSKRVNFELQIKAIVYTFWSEIEHKIVYKNNNYSLNNEFISQLLDSIRTSLTSIDSQLNIIYNEMQFQTNKKRELDENSIKNVIAKSINDLFIDKIQDSIGFTINFKKTCDLLSDYLYSRQQNQQVSNERTLFVSIARRIQEIKEEKMDFEGPIIFRDEIVFQDRFSQIMGSAFLWYMNSDFEWYVFFKMLFAMMPASTDIDFRKFIELYRNQFDTPVIFRYLPKRFVSQEAKEVKDEILANVALTLVEVGNIAILHDEKLDRIIPILQDFDSIFDMEITNYSEWNHKMSFMLDDLKQSILLVFHKHSTMALNG